MNTLKITIPDPCHENWDKMLPHEQGKFCASCQKCVVDFSTYSDAALLKYFETPRVNTCGQFNEKQLQRFILPPQQIRPSFYSKAILGIAVFLSLFHVTDAKEFPIENVNTETLINNTSPNDEFGPFVKREIIPDNLKRITGTILDSVTNRPVIDVIVKLKNRPIGMFTNADGKFNLTIPDSLIQKKIILQIIKIGYTKQELPFENVLHSYNLNICMGKRPDMQCGIVAEKQLLFAGGISPVIRYIHLSKLQRLKRFLGFKLDYNKIANEQ